MYLLAIPTGEVADANKVKHTEARNAIQLGKIACGCNGGDGGAPSTPHPRVVVVETSIAAAGDRRPRDSSNRCVPSLHRHHDLTACRTDRDTAMIYTNAPVGFLVPSAGLDHAADANLNLGVAREEHVIKDPVLHHDISRELELELIRGVAGGSAVGTGSVLVDSIPYHEAFFRDSGGSGLLHRDVVRESLAPSFVGHILDIVERSTTNVKSLVLAVI